MNAINVGDLVKITPMYMSIYTEWGDRIKDKPAKVLSVKSQVIYDKNLSKEDRHLFQSFYGRQSQYELIELMIEIDNNKYMVSQFGFNKE